MKEEEEGEAPVLERLHSIDKIDRKAFERNRTRNRHRWAGLEGPRLKRTKLKELGKMTS